MKRFIGTLLAVTALWNVALAAAPSVEVVEETAAYRVVKHVLGETQIPTQPERVVALSEDIIDPLLALGIEPVAAGESLGDAFAPYYADRLVGIPSVGQFWEPNLEAILAANPDLIVDWARTERSLYEQLTKIAPTVLISTDRDGREVLLELGRVLGMEAEARVAQYEKTLDDARERLEGAIGDETVLVLDVSNRDLYLYGTNDIYVGPVLYDLLGLTPAPVIERLDMEMEDWGGLAFSLERLPELDADHIFLLNGRPSPESDETIQQLTSSSLWQNLSAVQRGNVYPIQRDGWLSAAVLANEHKVNDVLNALIGQRD